MWRDESSLSFSVTSYSSGGGRGVAVSIDAFSGEIFEPTEGIHAGPESSIAV